MSAATPSGGAAPLTHLDPTRLHWIAVVRDIPVRQLLQNLVAPAVAAFSALGPAGGLRAIAAIVVVWFLYRLLAWRNRKLSLVDGVLTDRRGVLVRKERQMAVARLQQVDVERGPIERAFKVAHVRLEAAADAGSTEIDLRAVPLDLASQLATLRRVTPHDGPPAAVPGGPTDVAPATTWPDAVGTDGARADAPDVVDAHGNRRDVAPHGTHDDDARTSPSPSPAPAPAEVGADVAGVSEVTAHRGELVYAPSLGEVALAAATGRRLAALPLAVAALLQLVGELELDAGRFIDAPTLGGSALGVAVQVAGALLFGLVVAVASAVGLGLLRDGNMEVRRDGRTLHVRRGLLTFRSATIQVRRVQSVQVRRNVLRDRLGFVSVELQTSAVPDASAGDQGERRIALPFVPEDVLETLLGDLVPAVADPPSLRLHPPRARPRLVRRAVLFVLGLSAPLLLLVVLTAGPAWLSPIVVGAVLVGWLVGRRAFALQALGADDRMVVATSGILARDETRVPVAKVQSAWLRSQPFQRRVDLVTLKVSPAGGGFASDLTATDVDPADAEPLARRLTAMAPTFG